MNITLWIIQGFLATLFLAVGALKVSQPLTVLDAKLGGWVQDVSLPVIRLVAALEIVGAAGLILPRALNVAPALTGAAAFGLTIFMAGAAVVHARRGEHREAIVNVVLGLLTLVVAFGRI